VKPPLNIADLWVSVNAVITSQNFEFLEVWRSHDTCIHDTGFFICPPNLIV